MNKTIVGIFTLGVSALGLNALQDDTATPSIPVSPRTDIRTPEVAPTNTHEKNTRDTLPKPETDTKKIIPTETQKTPIEIPPKNTNQTTSRLDEEVRSKPAKQKIQEPTKSNCDPNYSGCVPIDTDVDCAGGRGNGPSYVRGPVRVTGSDIYDLDRDGNGWGCE